TLLYQKRNGFLLFYPKKCPKSERYANTFGTSSETQPKGWVFRFPSISFNGIGLKSSLRAEIGDNIDGG
ncbi:hypothetical protein, partial [Geobacillus sp. 47C-IIb]|uniref:hypothetical protein n=1 Tax=Geobacillus sp. 47C-IIb TaxID=1963026 RepID=UPI001E39847B